jgi:hypothetical protein
MDSHLPAEARSAKTPSPTAVAHVDMYGAIHVMASPARSDAVERTRRPSERAGVGLLRRIVGRLSSAAARRCSRARLRSAGRRRPKRRCST